MKFGKSKNTPAVYEDVTTGLKKIYKVDIKTLIFKLNYLLVSL